ncbi:MAG TPA: hypothetical protein VGX23_17460 [Actinocrinis sp.]|nr:hypothetical protein [Actinocrinis sp.]
MEISEDPARAARQMWTLFEPVHAVVYFTPPPRAAFEAAGVRGFWRGYFAGRAAPFGAVGPAIVQATFYGFAPQMVRRALPSVWDMASPEVALTTRAAGSRASLQEVLGDVDVAEAAQLLRAAAESVDVVGRALAAANAALPWPEDPLDVLWHAATLLREHRGDGHVAALLVAGLDGCESLVWRSAVDSDRQILQPIRGWTDEEWEAATARLTARGWLDADGRATTEALAARDRIEASTDLLAAGPWQALGRENLVRLAQLMHPLASTLIKALPIPNPIGLVAPLAA